MPQTLTIVFRGLMIFHEDKKNNLMEIGILREPTHVPRILTIANGVLADVEDLRPRLGDPAHRRWQVNVTNPASKGVRIYTNGSANFNRQTHPDDRDFRFIMDFEADEFYDRDLTGEMLTANLIPVLQIPHGQFYTHLKSPNLNRSADGGEAEEFGPVASVTGCEISIEGGEVSLNVVETDDEVFSFTQKRRQLELPENAFFEITNTPPDVLLGDEHGHGHGGGANPNDHFQFYYDLFDPQNIPRPKFGFVRKDPSPAPNPLLCGKGQVGKRTDPL